MPEHTGLTITTTDAEEAVLDAYLTSIGKTLQQHVQDVASDLISDVDRGMVTAWWNGLTEAEQKTIYQANQP